MQQTSIRDTWRSIRGVRAKSRRVLCGSANATSARDVEAGSPLDVHLAVGGRSGADLASV